MDLIKEEKTMAKENVKNFYEEVSKNKELQKKIEKAQAEYKGDVIDRESVAQEIILKTAKEAGYDFTVEELRTFERETAISHGINEEELENVSGGGGACLALGLGAGVSACVYWGGQADISSGVNGDATGIHVCVFIGFGMGEWFS